VAETGWAAEAGRAGNVRDLAFTRASTSSGFRSRQRSAGLPPKFAGH